MANASELIRRGLGSAVAWSWVFNGLRLASGLLLLPLLLHRLSEADLGMYYLFLSLVAIIPVLDASLSVNISRHVGYAMAGATSLRSTGLGSVEQADGPNRILLWRLLFATRSVYRLLAAAILVTLGVAGTAIVLTRVSDTDNPNLTWWAWGITLLSATVETYSSWGNVFIQGMNRVTINARLLALAYGLRLVLASVLLLAGAGLLSLPSATLVASALQRFLARRVCLRLLGEKVEDVRSSDSWSLVKTIWPNTWRVGLKLLSMYLSATAIAYIGSSRFGLAAFGQYGLSLQIMTIIHLMAGVWTSVKWPFVAQLRSQHKFDQLRALLKLRFWLQNLTFVVLAGIAIWAGQPMLDLWGTGKKLLPEPWFTLLGTLTLFEMQFAFWTYLLSTENRVPSLWATVITYPVGVALVVLLLEESSFGLGALVVGPFVAGCLFNYWFWPAAGARSLKTTGFRFMFWSEG